jgi:hypothetical protein
MAKKIKEDKDTKEDKSSKVVERAKKFFERVITAESRQRTEELDDIRFVGLLDQWPQNIRKIRESDPQGSRPCLTVDKVNQYKNQIVNQMRQNRPAIKARPVDDNGDIEVAEVYQGIIRHIEDVSKADIAYDWAGEGAVTSGLGYFRIITEYTGDSFEQEIRIARIRNRFSVYFDPDAKEPDGSDAKEVIITEMVNRDKFKEEYPDADPCDWESSTGDNNNWYNQDDVRVAEYFYIDYQADKLLLLEDGNVIFETDYNLKYPPTSDSNPSVDVSAYPVIVKSRKAAKTIVKWCKLTGAQELESTIIPGSFIPVIPVIGIETDVDGVRYLRGIVRGVKDAQRLYNYNRSTIAENLNLSIKAPYIGYTGQFKTAGDKWAAANRVNYAYLEADPVTVNGNLASLPQRQGFAGVPTGLLQDIQTSEHDIQSALGMYQASVGQDSNAKSGRALNAQKTQGEIATFHFPDNLGRSIRHGGRIIVEMIPKIYDTKRIVRILGEDGTVNHAQIDPESPDALREERAKDGAIKKIYNLGVGKYDVTVTTGASYATKREEGADFLTQVVQSSPDLMPIVGDYLFKSMDVPYAQEMAERMKKMMPPQLQEGNGEEPPEVMQIKQQADEVIKQLQMQLDKAEQAMLEANEEAKELQNSANDKEGELALKAREIEIKEFEAQTKRLQVELTAMQGQSEIDTERLQMIEDAVAKIIDTLEPQELEQVMQ